MASRTPRMPVYLSPVCPRLPKPTGVVLPHRFVWAIHPQCRQIGQARYRSQRIVVHKRVAGNVEGSQACTEQDASKLWIAHATAQKTSDYSSGVFGQHAGSLISKAEMSILVMAHWYLSRPGKLRPNPVSCDWQSSLPLSSAVVSQALMCRDALQGDYKDVLQILILSTKRAHVPSMQMNKESRSCAPHNKHKPCPCMLYRPASRTMNSRFLRSSAESCGNASTIGITSSWPLSFSLLPKPKVVNWLQCKKDAQFILRTESGISLPQLVDT
jgi:hypothetical protein